MLGLLHTRTVCTTHTAAVPCPRHLGTQHAHSRCRVKAAAPYQGEAERQQQGFAAPPNSIHCTDPVVTHAEQVLDRAERDLADYCALASFPECWAAHTYLAEKRHAAQKDDDPEHKGLLELEQLALNGMEVGSAAFARTLLLLQKSEARRRAAAEASTTVEHTSGALSSSAASSSTGSADDVVAAARRRLEGLNTEQRRRRFALLSLFQSYDVDHDGLIDLEQTQLALESLGAVLTDEDWATMSDALDHKFKIDFEDFMEVAEEWAPPTAVDALLTALAQPKQQQQQAQKDQQAPTAGQQQGVAEAAPSGPCTAAITGEAPAIRIDSKSFLRHSTHMHGRHGHR